jgi:hypothetical protein
MRWSLRFALKSALRFLQNANALQYTGHCLDIQINWPLSPPPPTGRFPSSKPPQALYHKCNAVSVGYTDQGPFPWYEKHSIQLDMFLQDLVIQMALAKDSEMAIPHVPSRDITASGIYKFESWSYSLYTSCPTMWCSRSVLLRVDISSVYPIKTLSLLIAFDLRLSRLGNRWNRAYPRKWRVVTRKLKS